MTAPTVTGEHPRTPAAAAREKRATFAAGLLASGQWDMLAVVPLYALLVGLSPIEIGLVVGARSLLPTLLAIHGGILMDRFGARRLMLSFVALSAMLPLAYPVTGWFAVLYCLQLALGLGVNLSMSGAKTLINQMSGGNSRDLTTFSFASRVGTFTGPVLVGAFWEAAGPWAAFSGLALWGGGALIAVLAVPSQPTERDVETGGLCRWGAVRELLPRWGDHVVTGSLAAGPAVAFILAVTFLRNGPGAIQASFYVVYLGQVDLNPTVIGPLVALSEASGALGALFAVPVSRIMRPHAIVLPCVASAIFFIVITPLIAESIVLLAAAAALRGLFQGMNQPVLFSILSQAVGTEAQGTAVGLYNAVNRFSSIVLPVLMGSMVAFWEVSAGFYLMGAILLAPCGVLAWWRRGRSRNFA